MHWKILLLSLCALAVSAEETTTFPTTPKEYPPETGRPKDMKYCRINANTVLPWVVGVWSIPLNKFIGHGSMITYISFISSCKLYRKHKVSNWKAVGQYIWNVSLPDQPCMQEKLITNIFKHPRCEESSKTATFFDFAVFKLIYPFEITGPNFPTLSFTNTPYELMSAIRYINIIPNTTGCILPYFRNQIEKPPVFDFESFVEAIPFRTKCVPLLCQLLTANDTFSTMCRRRLGERAKATLLCMKNKVKSTYQASNRYWYTGTPLVCNGTAYGLASQAKNRSEFPENTDDIHFVVTFLRVWPWLINLIKDNSVPWVRHLYIEDMKLKPVDFRSEAPVISSQPLKNLLAVVILLHFYFQRTLHPFNF